jgi:hypothetical protein
MAGADHDDIVFFGIKGHKGPFVVSGPLSVAVYFGINI